MNTLTFRPRKLADLTTIIPGLDKVWKQIKAECGTKARTPKTVSITDASSPMYPDDASLCRRFALNIETMSLSGGIHVSAGEWAVHAGPNHDEAVEGVGNGQALIDCEWNDYYGTFYMRIQVAKGAIPAQLTA